MIRLIIVVTFLSQWAFGYSTDELKPFDTTEYGVKNQGFVIKASDEAKEIFDAQPESCDKFLNYIQDPMNTYGVTVVKNGAALFDLHEQGIQETDILKLFSSSKIVTAMMVGAILNKHPELSLSTPISRYVDLGSNRDDRNKSWRNQITLYDTLSMGTGLDWCEYANCAAIDTLKMSYSNQQDDA
ncbi:MAG: serine hydrolase, partial [Pseudomonadota bacterium]